MIRARILFLLCVFTVNSLKADDWYHVTLNTFKCRALSMGGAVTATQGALDVLGYNPASFSAQGDQTSFFYALYLNPMGLTAVAADYQKNWSVAEPMGLTFHGACFSWGQVNVGFIFGEESLENPGHLQRSQVISTKNYSSYRNSTIGLSLELAPRVSLGVAGEVFHRASKTYTGYRYGILVKPKEYFTVGLCFYDFPKEIAESRIPLERLADESLNLGISYEWDQIAQFNFDVRNVSDENKSASLEPHAGIELIPWRHLALRAGFFTDFDGHLEGRSVGIGLLDGNYLLPLQRRITPREFVIELSYLEQEMDDMVQKWLMISTRIRL